MLCWLNCRRLCADSEPVSTPICQRNVKGVGCTKGPAGAAAFGVEQVAGRWYCRAHIGVAKAIATKRRDRGFGLCNVRDCLRPAVEKGGKCTECRAGERASGAPVFVVDSALGKGDHPYAPKQAEIYLAVFTEPGLIKVGKATPWTVRGRVNDAADKLRLRLPGTDGARPVGAEPLAWAIRLFGDENVLWAVTERVEHAAAGRLAHNVGATSVAHTEGKANGVPSSNVRDARILRSR